MTPIKAIFLDRDGTINHDNKGYISLEDDFEIFSYSAKAIGLLRSLGYLIFVVTNQSGIARGFFDHNTLENIHQKMIEDLAKDGSKIDEIFVCPHHSEGVIPKYSFTCNCRKPKMGLFNIAKKKYNFETKISFMIGDKPSDILFGKHCGLTTILVLTGNGKDAFYQKKCTPDFVVKNLFVAAKLIKRLSLR